MQIGLSVKNQDRMASSVEPDETARYKQFHLEPHCLQRYLFWTAGLKGLIPLAISPKI